MKSFSRFARTCKNIETIGETCFYIVLQLFGQIKMELTRVFCLHALRKKAYLESIHYVYYQSYWKSIHHVHTYKLITKLLQALHYSKTVIRNGKKHSDIKVFIQLSWISNFSRSQLKKITIFTQYSLFCLVVLTVENPSGKPLLLVTYRNQVLLYFHFSLKSKKEQNNDKEKLHPLK